MAGSDSCHAAHTSRYEFANDIIRIMQDLSGQTGGWAKVRPITTDQYPLPARRPRNPVMSKDKVKRVFGIEMPDWTEQLQACLCGLSADASVSDRAAR